jgi:hypothetical protein
MISTQFRVHQHGGDLLPKVLNQNRQSLAISRQWGTGLLLVSLTGIVACDRAVPTQLAVRPSPQLSRAVISADDGMGTLAPIALQVVTGLQNVHVRAAVIGAMRDTSAHGYGLDLQDCQTTGVTRALFQAAEVRGGALADALCQTVSRLPGLILHMDHEQLGNWNPSIIPIVTAIAHPEAGTPRHLTGYRSPSRTIDLTADKHLQGPILVVFPARHPDRRNVDPKALRATTLVHIGPVNAPLSNKGAP